MRIGAGVKHCVGKEGGVFVGRYAAIFLLPLFRIDAFGFEAAEEMLTRFIATGFFVDAFDNAFGNGFLDGNLVEGPGRSERAWSVERGAWSIGFWMRASFV